jgi:hypothetical protein
MDYKDALKGVIVIGTDLFDKEIKGEIIGHIPSFKLVQVKYDKDRVCITTADVKNLSIAK